METLTQNPAVQLHSPRSRPLDNMAIHKRSIPTHESSSSTDSDSDSSSSSASSHAARRRSRSRSGSPTVYTQIKGDNLMQGKPGRILRRSPRCEEEINETERGQDSADQTDRNFQRSSDKRRESRSLSRDRGSSRIRPNISRCTSSSSRSRSRSLERSLQYPLRRRSNSPRAYDVSPRRRRRKSRSSSEANRSPRRRSWSSRSRSPRKHSRYHILFSEIFFQ